MTGERAEGRVPPHNLDAEASLLGACLLSKEAIKAAVPIVSSDEFYKPAHGHIFEAISALYQVGEPVDPVTVGEDLRRSGLLDAVGGSSVLVSLLAGTPATSNAHRYARIIAELCTLRRLIGAAGEMADIGYSVPDDVGEAIDRAQALVAALELPVGRLPEGLTRLDDVLDRPEAERKPWVLPGLLRLDWRVTVVAPEGAGKTELLHQLAHCAAQGIHPFKLHPIPPVKVLLVDFENPEERIIEGGRPWRAFMKKAVGEFYDPDRIWLWHHPGGIDLRTRAAVGSLEAVIAKVRPQLVCMGPVYKMSSRLKGEGWDEAALATQRVLDDLRTRYGFALLLEDHAPQASGGLRDLRPFGSAKWMGWPELGLKMVPEGEGPPWESVQLGRWRGDRLRNAWPAYLDRGKRVSWEGRWTRNDEAPE